MRTPEPFDRSNGHDREAAIAALAVVDEALGSGHVTVDEPRERELQELALALRAQAPSADPGFAARLDERVQRGFAPDADRRRSKPPAAARARRRLLGGRPPLRIVAAAASVFIALLVGASVYVGVRDPDGAAIDGDAAPLQEGPGSGDALLEEAKPSVRAPSTPGGEALDEPNRRVVRAASMTLAAPAEDLAGVADDVPGIVQRHRGFVLRSSVTAGDQGATGGSFDLRVPATELDATLADLSDLGQVRSQTQTDDDVTGAFVSVRDRFVAARAERRGLLRRLERAATPAEATAIRERVDRATRTVNRIRGDLDRLETQTTFANVTLSLVSDDAATSGTGDALDDMVDSLLGAFNLALRVLGFALPLVILAALAWVAARALRRRRREAVLEQR